MGIWDVIGLVMTTVLTGGLIWGLVDLLVRIHRLPVQKGKDRIWVLSTYPFMRKAKDKSTPAAPPFRTRDLQPAPVRVRANHRG